MRIREVELFAVVTRREMGRRGPSDSEPAISHHVVVRLHTDGPTGLGEMSDVNWSVDSASLEALRQRLLPYLLGADLDQFGVIGHQLRQDTWEHQVLCGIDIAIHHAIARARQIPLYSLLGGRYRERVRFAYPLAPCQSEADVKANLDRVSRLQDAGHDAIRYYFGADLTQDEAFLSQARQRWGDRLTLRALDASGRFTPDEAIAAAHRLGVFGPELLESPVIGRHEAPAEDFLAVHDAIDLPISEHIADDPVGWRLSRSGGIDIFNTGLGYAGIGPCRNMFELARISGLRALMGSTVEMSIGTAARAHVAASVPNLDLGAYMAGPLVYDDDVAREQVVYEEGCILIDDRPGHGIELDETQLERLRP